MRSSLPPNLTPPRKVTPRDHSRRTHGAKVAAVAESLGQPLLPWQRYVADVALEVDHRGVFVYSKVLITVQRQAGKTTLTLAALVQRALMGRNRRAWYTAQSGAHATEKFLEMADLWQGSAINALAPKPRRSNGSAALEFIQGSKMRPFPPLEGALDGKQSDMTTMDEFWYHSAAQYSLMRQSYQPTQTTRRKFTGQRPQNWLLSTEGTVESEALNLELDEFRSGEAPPTTAGFDWGLADDDDPENLDVVYAKHPGAGHLFTRDDLDTFRAEFGDESDEFARAHGNRRTGATQRVIPAAAAEAARWRDEGAPSGPICFGAAHGIDGVDTTITATQRIDQHATLTAVVKGGHGPGTTWALPRLLELAEKYPDAAFAIDRYGPSASLHDAADRAGLRLVPLASSDVTAATQNIYADLTNPGGPTARYKPHDATAKALELATKRFTSDGTWLFGRRASVGSISALEAWNLGHYGIDHMPAVRAFQLG